MFWFWNDYRHFLRKAGVSAAAVERHTKDQTKKYAVMRALLEALDKAGSRGQTVQRDLVRNLVALELRPQEGLDFEEAKAAQARLRACANEHGLLPETIAARQRAEQDAAARRRRAEATKRAKEREEQVATMAALRAEFAELLRAPPADRQERGYRLEELIGKLAHLEGLRYTPPYRKRTATQTDGMITFEGFQYLIEARWRMTPANVGQVDVLGGKARRASEHAGSLHLDRRIPPGGRGGTGKR